MSSKLDRTGEENINNFGSKMVITRYKSCKDIDVYFPEYNWTAKNVQYTAFKKGNIKCPYEPRVYGKGYLGEGRYKAWENGKHTQCYKTWQHMLERCYDNKYKEKHPTYVDCEVCNEWHNFQNFAEWYYNNYYDVDDETMCLDKDILNKKNKIYSPNNCIFVPHNINVLFVKSDKTRGEYPIGVDYHKNTNKFRARCSIYDHQTKTYKNKHLGFYDTINEAFKIYKKFKEYYIKKVANYYKGQIPAKLYDTMYNYEVEIDD